MAIWPSTRMVWAKPPASGSESPGITSLLAIAAWAVLFGVVAVWRFNLEEF